MYMQVSNKKYQYFEIDEEDFNKIKKFSWSVGKDGYIRGRVGGPDKFLLHRFILDLKIGDPRMVDHKDGDKSNNRKNNLRLCNQRENLGNSKICKRNKSNYKGVSTTNGGKDWRARIHNNGEEYIIGRYDSAIDAAIAYDKMAIEIFGEFARLNFDKDSEHYHLKNLSRIDNKKKNSSKYRGVSLYNNKYWMVKCNRFYIGTFKTEEDGARAWDKYILDNKLDGYKLNFPEVNHE